MSLKDSNLYGTIRINRKAVATVAGTTTLESYGVWGLKGITPEKLARKKRYGSAVRVAAINNRITINLSLILKYGVSAEPVLESVRSAVKYNVENFAGMSVDSININVVGIKN